jgi:hypothetical protein
MSIEKQKFEKSSNGQSERALTLWHSYLTGDHSRLDPTVRIVR